MAAMNLDVGSQVGDYQIIAILGAGGMGKVFKVRNTISDRVEAMKVLLPDLTGAPELADRFLREIKVHASLDHPNIASLRTALHFGNQLLMVMELVEGVDLDHKLKERTKFTPAEAADYIGQVLDALGYAHRLGVIHRDIKPANMMLTNSGVVKLMDFGIAKGAADRKLTMTGTTMGSLYYMSPEQIQGASTLDNRTDLYALGVSLYELVTGKRPFDGDSQFAIMAAHLQSTPVAPITIDPTVPPALNDVILHSVEKNPDERYQTAEDFRTALRAAMSPPPATVRMKTAPLPVGATTVAPPPPAGPAAAPVAAFATEPAPPKSRRLLWVGAGAFCAVAAVVGIMEFAPFKRAAAGGAGPGQIETQLPVQQTPQTVPASPQQAVPAPSKTVPDDTRHQAAAPPPVQQNPAKNVPRPSPQQQPSDPPPVQQQPQQQQQAPPPVQQASPTQPPAGPSPTEIARRAELKKASDALDLLQVRAGTIQAKLSGVERQQQAQGMGLRSDWVSARSLMDQFLKRAEGAISAGDPAAAQDALDKAERQAGILEKALHI